MEIVHVYQKKRIEFGKQPIFSDRLAEITTAILPNPSYMKNYVERNPTSTETQATPDKSEHEVLKCLISGEYRQLCCQQSRNSPYARGLAKRCRFFGC
jgi:hypothetical protein